MGLRLDITGPQQTFRDGWTDGRTNAKCKYQHIKHTTLLLINYIPLAVVVVVVVTTSATNFAVAAAVMMKDFEDSY